MSGEQMGDSLNNRDENRTSTHDSSQRIEEQGTDGHDSRKIKVKDVKKDQLGNPARGEGDLLKDENAQRNSSCNKDCEKYEVIMNMRSDSLKGKSLEENEGLKQSLPSGGEKHTDSSISNSKSVVSMSYSSSSSLSSQASAKNKDTNRMSQIPEKGIEGANNKTLNSHNAANFKSQGLSMNCSETGPSIQPNPTLSTGIAPAAVTSLHPLAAPAPVHKKQNGLDSQPSTSSTAGPILTLLAPTSVQKPSHGFRIEAVTTSSGNVVSTEHESKPNQKLREVSTTVPIAVKPRINQNLSQIGGNQPNNPLMANAPKIQTAVPQTTRPRSNSVPSYNSNGTSPNLPSTPSKSGRLRRGKWTVEEEAYVARVIQDFNSGYLDAPAGTTLRTFLSDKLNCDPMRITKKFTGDSCIGKRVFHPAVRCANNALAIDKAQSELDALERRWRKRLEMQQRESAKKQAASAAAAAAAAASGRLHVGHTSDLSQNSSSHRAAFSSPNEIAQTASWLDRANAILSNAPGAPGQPIYKVNSREDAVAKEMEEVQRLIHEGPIIQKTSAGLTTTLLERSADVDTSHTSNSNIHPSKRKVSDDPVGKSSSISALPSSLRSPSVISTNSTTISTNSDSNNMNIATSQCYGTEKRFRRSVSANNMGLATTSADAAEDAATLMGFLSSVRQAAASGAAPSK